MPAYRFPILIWQDFAGRHTACLVDDAENVAAVGDTPGDAAWKVKEFLQWRYRERPWTEPPDFQEPALSFVRVEVRPEYEVGGRKFPSAETLPLRVACVTGKDSHGLLLCALPTLGARFNYYDPAAFKGLVTHYVQTLLEGMTPQELSRLLPPPSAVLDDVVVQVPRKERKQKDEAAIAALAEVAEPVAARGARRRGVRAWERDAEVARLGQVLARERASVLLVGEGGAGKSTVLAEAVRKVEREKPTEYTEEQRKAMRDAFGATGGAAPADEDLSLAARAPGRHRFWLTSASRLIAGMQYLGQWQERCEQVVAELAAFAGVLCLENLLDLVRTGGREPAASLAGFLLPYLQRGELRIVAEATPAELDACRRLLPGLADVFQVVTVPPFTRTQAIAALDGLAGSLEQNLKVELERGTVEQVYRLFSRFLPYQSFPGRASSFVVELFDRAAREKPADGATRAVTPRRAVEHFVRRTGLPELLLRDDIRLEHAEVFEHFRRRVIGQDGACRAVADVVTTFKAGLNDPGRPVGVMLFAGPTGVGKTELARALSQYLFGHGEEKDRLVRLDMSEYAGPGAAARLVGEAEGEPSELVRRIRQQPFAVVLLDEIEKAAPEVFDVLLGVLDEGRLTDRFGRLSTFRSAILVMTSNLGANRTEPFGLSRQLSADYDSEVMAFFRPEFFNRIDAVVTFEPLGAETVRAIAAKELSDLSKREGLTRAELKLTWTDRLVAHLAERGYDRRYGARPLQRTIEATVVTPLARFLLDRPGLRGARVHLDLGAGGDVTFDARD